VIKIEDNERLADVLIMCICSPVKSVACEVGKDARKVPHLTGSDIRFLKATFLDEQIQ